MVETIDAYWVLGVARDATDDKIRKAYRRLARDLHPDVAGPDGAERMAEVNAAYDVLSDPVKRHDLNAALDAPPEPEPVDEAPEWGAPADDWETWGAWAPEEQVADAPPVPQPVPGRGRVRRPIRWRRGSVALALAAAPLVALLSAHSGVAWAWAGVGLVLSVQGLHARANALSVSCTIAVGALLWWGHPSGVLPLLAATSAIVWPAVTAALIRERR